MKTWSLAAGISGLLVLLASAAQAGYCGADCYRHCRARVGCCAACSAVVCTCPPVEFEEKQVTEYESRFKEVEQTKVIDVAKFVEDVEEREVTFTVWREEGCACGCSPCCGTCCKKVVPVQCVRKVKVPVIREVPAKETLKFTRIVEEKIPRTYTCKVPKASCCQSCPPACTPVPCCGRK